MELKWEERLNTGVFCFDEEHKTILNMLNFMRELLQNKRRQEASSFIVDVLIPYLRNHLRHEEEVFKQFGYPEGETHTKSHEAIEKLFMGFMEPLEAGEDKVIKHFQAVVIGWLYGHIEKTDKRYGVYFADKGIIDKVNEIEPVRNEFTEV
ncbi:bacteriohemerythrin [Aquifex pyrophilus]